jgi:hypothetical protein
MSTEDGKKPRIISAHMTVLDVLDRYRQTEKVFKEYDDQVGECICCAALFNTLADVASSYNLDLEKLLNDLESVVDAGGEKRKV